MPTPLERSAAKPGRAGGLLITSPSPANESIMRRGNRRDITPLGWFHRNVAARSSNMATKHESASEPAVELAPAERGEHWWPVALAIVVAALLHVALPARYRVQPAWVVPAVLLGLVAVLIAGDPGRIDRQKTWLRVVTGVVIALLTLANVIAAGGSSRRS